MGISLYYEARRTRPLSAEEQSAIDSAVARYPVEALFTTLSLLPGEYTGEPFVIYPAGDHAEPGVVFEGATKLPSNSEEVFWEAIQFWCELLTEVRRLLPDAAWVAHIDDRELYWDEENRRYNPSA